MGEQTLNHCLKFVNICMNTKEIRKVMREHMQQILTEIPLMVMAVSPKEAAMFQNVTFFLLLDRTKLSSSGTTSQR